MNYSTLGHFRTGDCHLLLKIDGCLVTRDTRAGATSDLIWKVLLMVNIYLLGNSMAVLLHKQRVFKKYPFQLGESKIFNKVLCPTQLYLTLDLLPWISLIMLNTIQVDHDYLPWLPLIYFHSFCLILIIFKTFWCMSEWLQWTLMNA